jgi:hypothetical protein
VKRWKFGMGTVQLVMGLLSGYSVFAQSTAGCGPGNQDATCLGHVYSVAQSPPTCPSGPGYAASPAAVWLGSHFSTPACGNYQAPPTCLSGYTQTTSPSWNGSAWVGLGCEPPASPPSNPSPSVACMASLPSGYQLSGTLLLLGNYWLQASWTNELTIPDGPNPSYFLAYAEESGYPVSSPNDSAYVASAIGPPFQDGVACNAQNTYEAVCLVSPSGSVDTVYALMEGATTGQCNH